MSVEDYEKMSDSEKKKEDWMNSKWRPMCGWLYMGVCLFDFVVFPVLWSSLQAFMHGTVNSQWQPLTLQGAGLFHLSFGAIIGIAAFGRTQEKLAGANNGGLSAPSGVGTTYTPPPAPAAGGFGSAEPATGGFGAAPTSGTFNPTSSWGTTPISAPVVAGFGGKPAPVQPPQPIL